MSILQVWFQNRRAKERSTRQKQQSQSTEQGSSSRAVESLLKPQRSEAGSAIASALITASSPVRPNPLPLFLRAGRRRSLSTSALISNSSTPSIPEDSTVWIAEDPNQSCQPITSRSGPVRPRFGRTHTHVGLGVYSRPLQIREGSYPRRGANSTSPVQSRRPLSSSILGNPFHPAEALSALPSTDVYERPRFLRTAEEAAAIRAQPSGLVAPGSSPPESNSIAGRRNNRLPPIKLLIDEIDTAMQDDPARFFGPTTAQSCPSLVSPFERLELQSPLDGRSGYSEGGLSYFDQQRTPTSRYSPPVFNLEYRFGRTSGSEPAEGQ